MELIKYSATMATVIQATQGITWQRTGAVGEGGLSHPDDTLRGQLQPG